MFKKFLIGLALLCLDPQVFKVQMRPDPLAN